jgi:predicted amidophosphoribosyltransferase
MKTSEKAACRCPYCDEPVSPDKLFCQPCQVKLVVCEACGKTVAETAKRCPHCGRERPPRNDINDER